jgi:hypothetical protein
MFGKPHMPDIERQDWLDEDISIRQQPYREEWTDVPPGATSSGESSADTGSGSEAPNSDDGA